MKIAIGSDHAGFEMKEKLKQFLANRKLEVLDCGPQAGGPVEYVPIAKAVAQRTAAAEVAAF